MPRSYWTVGIPLSLARSGHVCAEGAVDVRVALDTQRRVPRAGVLQRTNPPVHIVSPLLQASSMETSG
jgi:hypothetical protein